LHIWLRELIDDPLKTRVFMSKMMRPYLISIEKCSKRSARAFFPNLQTLESYADMSFSALTKENMLFEGLIPEP